MRSIRRWPFWCVSGLGLLLATLSGCQTWVPEAGLTLPSGRYLDHPPQYIPQSPPFPLERELAHQQEAANVPPAGVLPPPVPPPPPVPAGPKPAPVMP